MKIQVWRRKSYDKKKNNLYLRYRINQNKAKVESMNLWEWSEPKSEIETSHNKSVQIACDEIIRRTKDDLDNKRKTIHLEIENDNNFKNCFFKYSNINNTEAIYKFIKKLDENFDKRTNKEINNTYLKKLKSNIEENIEESDLNGSTAAKYWNNFKTVLINLNQNKKCEYPKIGGIIYTSKKKKNKIFKKKEIKTLINTDIKKWKDLKKAFLFCCDTGLKLSILKKLKWENIHKNDNTSFYYYMINDGNKKYINTFSSMTREILGKRKKNHSLIFKLPKKQSNMSKIFSEWIKRSKIKGNKKFNDAINTYAYNKYKKSKNIYKISAALGHSSIDVTKQKYEYMNELDFFEDEVIENKITIKKNKNIKKTLFKKGNLLTYK